MELQFFKLVSIFWFLYHYPILSQLLLTLYATFLVDFHLIKVFFSPGFYDDVLSTSQEIGWEKHLRYDLSSAEWDIKPQLNRLITE